jgi:hypothetical protein
MTNTELAVLKLAHRGFMVRLESGLYRWTAKSEDPRHKDECLDIIQEYTRTIATAALRQSGAGPLPLQRGKRCARNFDAA